LRASCCLLIQLGNAHRENIGCILALQKPERQKVTHQTDQDFPDLVIVIQSDCGQADAVQKWGRDELVAAPHERSIKYSAPS
jgi:hypothetical protein